MLAVQRTRTSRLAIREFVNMKLNNSNRREPSSLSITPPADMKLPDARSATNGRNYLHQSMPIYERRLSHPGPADANRSTCAGTATAVVTQWFAIHNATPTPAEKKTISSMGCGLRSRLVAAKGTNRSSIEPQYRGAWRSSCQCRCSELPASCYNSLQF